MAEETKIEVIAGPNGEAEIYELYEDYQPLFYQYPFQGAGISDLQDPWRGLLGGGKARRGEDLE